MITSHTDVVGSLLRPPALLRAREEVAAGRISAAEFKAIVEQYVAKRFGVDGEAEGEGQQSHPDKSAEVARS